MSDGQNEHDQRLYAAQRQWESEVVVVTERIDCSQLTTGGSCSVTEGSQTRAVPGILADDFTLDTSYPSVSMPPLPALPPLDNLPLQEEEEDEPELQETVAADTQATEVEEEDNEEEIPIPKKARKRFVFQKKNLIAKKELFLNPLYVPQFLRVCDADLELQGYVVRCPNKGK